MEGNVNISPPDGSSSPIRESVNSYQESQETTSNALSFDEEDCYVTLGEGGVPIYFHQEFSRRCLVKMIIMHEYPLTIVDHIQMRMFTSILQPSFKFPSLNTIKEDIILVYKKEKLKLTKALDQNGSRVAISTNMWTSHQRKGYMVVTAHYIDSSWDLQNRVLSCTYVPIPHTSKVLAQTLMNILLEWNIDTKLSTITLDSSSTIDSTMHELLGHLDEGYLLLGGKLHRMHCCAHILNLIVKDGLDMIKECVEKIHNSVLYWSATPIRHQTFVTWCSKLGVPFTEKLVIDCPTRWNSTYVMLNTAWLYKDVFLGLRQLEPQYTSVPSNEEWELAKDICDRLKVFYDVTQLFSKAKYQTANLYFIQFCQMKSTLDKWVTSPNPLVSRMGCNMLTKFEKYWDDVIDIMAVAAVLDPRYKMRVIEFCFSKLYPVNHLKQVERIRQICYDLINEYQQKKSPSSSSEEELSEEDPTACVDHRKAFRLYMRENKRAKDSFLKNELDRYLDDGVGPIYSNFDILVWWRWTGGYPTLKEIARDLLAIPVSTIASESAFGSCGRVISPHHGKLKEDMIEALICARNWLLASENEASENEDGNRLSSNGYSTINDDEETGDELSNLEEICEA